MIREARIAVFLAKAKDADEEAEKAQSPEAKDQWLKIAEGYRALAKMT